MRNSVTDAMNKLVGKCDCVVTDAESCAPAPTPADDLGRIFLTFCIRMRRSEALSERETGGRAWSSIWFALRALFFARIFHAQPGRTTDHHRPRPSQRTRRSCMHSLCACFWLIGIHQISDLGTVFLVQKRKERGRGIEDKIPCQDSN